MQQKIIEKPNVDAHYNAAQYKYRIEFAVKLGPELVSLVGWDDKTGVDVWRRSSQQKQHSMLASRGFTKREK